MSGIFPIVQPETENLSSSRLPLCQDAAWDYDRGIPVFSGGNPVTVTGAEAVKTWCWRALKTVRFRHDIFTWDYGCEVENLIGQAFTPEVKQSEAIRYVREALEINPYITNVQQIEVAFVGSQLTISCAVSTIYGEVSLTNVRIENS